MQQNTAIPDAPHGPPRNPAGRYKDKQTRKTAIDAFCWQCMGGTEDAANGAYALIARCPSGPESVNPCPLWPFRPAQI